MTNDTPGTFGDLWTSKRPLKASVVAVVVSVSSGGSPMGSLGGLWCHSESHNCLDCSVALYESL